MFDEFYDRLDKEKIISLLENSSSPFYESTLIRAGFPNLKIDFENALELFQSHFVLFNFLFNLQEKYQEENKYLHIHFMKIALVNYPLKNRCRFFNEDLMDFCNSITENIYCDFHKQIYGKSKIELLSNKHYYLCKENFYSLNKETAEAFMNGAWNVLRNYDEYKASFKILGLTENSNIKEIKKRFYKLSKETHPDLGGKNVQDFIKINNAYHFLMKTFIKGV